MPQKGEKRLVYTKKKNELRGPAGESHWSPKAQQRHRPNNLKRRKAQSPKNEGRKGRKHNHHCLALAHPSSQAAKQNPLPIKTAKRRQQQRGRQQAKLHRVSQIPRIAKQPNSRRKRPPGPRRRGVLGAIMYQSACVSSHAIFLLLAAHCQQALAHSEGVSKTASRDLESTPSSACCEGELV